MAEIESSVLAATILIQDECTKCQKMREENTALKERLDELARPLRDLIQNQGEEMGQKDGEYEIEARNDDGLILSSKDSIDERIFKSIDSETGLR